jgi:DUF4097 and DUF4098 domain-containing protein YvlB
MGTQTFPVAGLSRLVIDEMAGDGQIIGVAEAAEVQVSGPGLNGETLFAPEGEILHFRGRMVERVLVPAQLSVAVREVMGDMKVQDMQTEVSLEAVHGDLRLRNLSGPAHLGQVNGDVRADGVSEFSIGGCNGDLRVQEGRAFDAGSVDGDLRLVDLDSAHLGHVGGDFSAEKLRSALDVGNVNGDVRLSDIGGPASVQAVGGDFSAEKLSSALRVGDVNGDVRLNEISGPASVHSAGGDLRALGLTGGLTAPTVNGDVELQGPFGVEQEYVLHAHGDAHVHLPADADLKLTVRAHGRIRSDVQLTPAPDGTANFTAVVGRGTGRLSVESGGDLRLKFAGASGAAETREGRAANTENWSDLGERIRQQVSTSLAAAGINLDTGEVNFNWKRGSRGPRGARNSSFDPTQPPVPPARPATPTRPAAPGRPADTARGAAGAADTVARPSAEEQLAILRMVETGAITAQEAEVLLRALGA